MTHKIDNSGEANYPEKLKEIAQKLLDWQGPIVIISHVDPDGDALGSCLALKRALDSLGKTTTFAMEIPGYLQFLLKENEAVPALETLPENSLLAVLDVDLGRRYVGAPIEGAAFTINIDHHGSNPRIGDLVCVEPGKAATAQMIKDLLEHLPISWTPDIATPCLTGILTDTGNFKYTNTNASVLKDAAELISHGVNYGFLTDRLQWREKTYFKMLGKVMSTVDFPLEGLVATAYLTAEMEAEVGPSDDDSNDYVGLIRYAEGTKVAIFFKARADHTKISVRTRDGVSAQAICHALGGGGHVAAAGAKLDLPLEETQKAVLAETKKELERHGLI
ncbi:MAG: DHH family phosphoesterase [Trueperaceae bacterium]|nr:DHH family phosphoesterase [Trueperaceae bacterium]